MLFLIDYDRASGRVITMQTFNDEDRTKAADARLKLEIELNRARERREVVLLEAVTERALRRTHRRYFEDLAALANPQPA